MKEKLKIEERVIRVESEVDVVSKRISEMDLRIDDAIKNAHQSAVMSQDARVTSKEAFSVANKMYEELKAELKKDLNEIFDQKINPRFDELSSRLDGFDRFKNKLSWYEDLRRLFTSKSGKTMFIVVFVVIILVDKLNLTDNIVEILALSGVRGG